VIFTERDSHRFATLKTVSRCLPNHGCARNHQVL